MKSFRDRWEYDLYGNKHPKPNDVFVDAFGYPHKLGDYGEEYAPYENFTTDKKAHIDTHLHYSDPTARLPRTVFGKSKKELFYNYSDRLISKEWAQGLNIAKNKGLDPHSAAFFEEALKHFHDSDDLNLQHIILGCNMSNGYDYLVFGYTYTSKSKK